MPRRRHPQIAEQQVAIRLAHARQLHLRHDVLERGLEFQRGLLAAREGVPLAVQPLLLLQEALLELHHPLLQAPVDVVRIVCQAPRATSLLQLDLVRSLPRALQAGTEYPDHFHCRHARTVVRQADHFLELLDEAVHVEVPVAERRQRVVRLDLDRRRLLPVLLADRVGQARERRRKRVVAGRGRRRGRGLCQPGRRLALQAGKGRDWRARAKGPRARGAGRRGLGLRRRASCPCHAGAAAGRMQQLHQRADVLVRLLGLHLEHRLKARLEGRHCPLRVGAGGEREARLPHGETHRALRHSEPPQRHHRPRPEESALEGAHALLGLELAQQAGADLLVGEGAPTALAERARGVRRGVPGEGWRVQQRQGPGAAAGARGRKRRLRCRYRGRAHRGLPARAVDRLHRPAPQHGFGRGDRRRRAQAAALRRAPAHPAAEREHRGRRHKAVGDGLQQ